MVPQTLGLLASIRLVVKKKHCYGQNLPYLTEPSLSREEIIALAFDRRTAAGFHCHRKRTFNVLKNSKIELAAVRIHRLP
jgi:hypothetical protein